MNLRRLMLPVCVAASLPLVTAGTAAAQPTGAVMAHVQVTFHPTAATRAQTKAAQRITCTVDTDEPHHIPRRLIGVNAVVTCTQPVSNLELHSNIDKKAGSNIIVVSETITRNSGREFLDASATTPCVTGQYRGFAGAWITAPPGYTPRLVHITKASNFENLTC